MKKIRIAALYAVLTVVTLPCVMVFNDSETFWPNIIGLAYCWLLYKAWPLVKPKVPKWALNHFDNLANFDDEF